MSRIEFPNVIHLRCTPEMAQEVKERGGSRWLRSLIAANTRFLTDATAERPVSLRDTKRLDKRKRRRLT